MNQVFPVSDTVIWRNKRRAAAVCTKETASGVSLHCRAVYSSCHTRHSPRTFASREQVHERVLQGTHGKSSLYMRITIVKLLLRPKCYSALSQ